MTPSAGTRLQVRRARDAADDATTVLTLRGELDFETLPLAERELELAEADEPALLLVDLSGLEFMDSSGVRLVLVAEQRAEGAGRHLAVRLGEGPPRRVFQLLGLVEELDIR